MSTHKLNRMSGLIEDDASLKNLFGLNIKRFFKKIKFLNKEIIIGTNYTFDNNLVPYVFDRSMSEIFTETLYFFLDV